MTLSEALSLNPGFWGLGDRKAVAVELLLKEIDAIIARDDPYPCHWMRIIDIARQETGIAPHSAVND